MRAYAIGEEGGWTLGNAEDPPLRPGQVRVATRACSLNYRDHLVASGKYGNRLPVGLVPVSDGSGEVVEVGPDVTRWRVGDPVIGCFFDRWADGHLTPAKAKTARGGAISGVLAERFVAHEEGLVRKPDALSYEQAATLPCAALTAWVSLFEAARLAPGASVLLQGTGGVSVFALQFAEATGLRAFVTSSSDEKLVRARDMGAEWTHNYRTDPAWERAALAATGDGVDAVLEVGGADTLLRSLKAARFGGHVLVIGVLGGAGAELSIGHVQAKAIVLRGIYVGSTASFEAMLRSPIHPVIDRTFGFEEAPAALEHLASGRHFGKVVVRVE